MKRFFLLFFCFLLVGILTAVPCFATSDPGDSDVVSDAEPAAPLYQSAYDLFRQYVYGPDTVLTEHMELTLTILATIVSLFVVCLPFVVVFLIIRFVVR